MPYKDLAGISEGASSAEILKRVMGARKIHETQFVRTKIFANARMNSRHIKKYCRIDSESGAVLEKAMESFWPERKGTRPYFEDRSDHR